MKLAENYQVGALLYCPANQYNIADSIITNRFTGKYSLALCLEDTIAKEKVVEAEDKMLESLKRIYKAREKGLTFYLPKIFIRVREPEQILSLMGKLGPLVDIVTGFNLPKFNLENADLYLTNFEKALNKKSTLKFMPILESVDLANIMKRPEFLYTIKDKITPFEEQVLNVRVGGNDLCHIFGLRRHTTETIYDIKPVASALTDILSVFLTDYVVSGPVFEYYNGENWSDALRHELRKDIAAGFVGKTAIHPKQIAVINHACAVLKEDYDDAMQILNWNTDNYVVGSTTKSRMNEVKTHLNWANRIMAMAEYYGTK